MAVAVTNSITIDVVSDVICPWCFLGKRRLDKALTELSDVAAAITWRPFYLDPTIPDQGIDRRIYLANKFGEERLLTLHNPLIDAGKKDGVPYRFDKIVRTPNTRKAHTVLQLAAGSPRQHELAELLFMAYWNAGRDIGSEDELISVAAEAGLEKNAVKNALSDASRAAVVDNEVRQAQRVGITGVPTFILDRRLALVGAQPPEVIADAIRQATEPASPASS